MTKTCAQCGKTKRTCTYEPTLSAMIFGPFPGSQYFNTPARISMEWRCQRCDTIVGKRLDKMITNLSDGAK